METLINYSDSHIYPGEFIPNENIEESIEKSKINKELKIKKPSINLIELPELIKIEIALPGVRREEIIVKGEESSILIRAHHLKNDTQINEVCKFREFSYEEEFIRKVNLSENADISFMHAEHHHGILSIYIPKNKQKNKLIKYKSTIVVY